MADYTYKCPECGVERDISHPMSQCDDPNWHVHCDKCEEVLMVRKPPKSFLFRMEFVG